VEITLYKGRMLLVGAPFMQNLAPYVSKGGRYSFPICGDIVRRLPSSLVYPEDLRLHLSGVRARQREVAAWVREHDAPGHPQAFPYQRVGACWLKAVCKGILADEAGSGKTVTAILASEGSAAPLVLCSKTNIHQWLQHIKAWSSHPSRFRVTNYDSVTKISTQHDLVIVDEAHILRNRKTSIFKNISRLCKRAKYVFLLTATPTVNSATDYWALLNICDPARFGSYWGFVFRFFDVQHEMMGIKLGGLLETEKENFERIVRYYTLSRDVDQGLPGSKWEIDYYNLSGEHRELYEQMADTGICSYQGQQCEALTALSQITRERQLCVHPGTIFPAYSGPSKLDVLDKYKRHTVIFTQFADVAEQLQRSRPDIVTLTGRYTSTQRQQALEQFENGASICLTYKVGGESLNLQKASQVILLEYPWHPAGLKQAYRRVLRHGQKNSDVRITMIHARGTIDDYIRDIISEKQKVTLSRILQKKSIDKNTQVVHSPP
jgi:SNF2 family DNA or RNA helicase